MKPYKVGLLIEKEVESSKSKGYNNNNSFKKSNNNPSSSKGNDVNALATKNGGY